MKFTVALILLLTASLSFAESPMSVDDYVSDDTPVEESNEPSDEEFTEEVFELKERNSKRHVDINNSRINWTPSHSAGKLIIKVHKISATNSKEYLEVFRQNSVDASDLTPVLVFDNGTSHKALVSTATPKFKCRGGRPCSTPEGNFNIDIMETMHYSSRFNNAPMPWSMFFLGSVGIAIHGATPSEYKDLGKKASHGCVRIHPTNGKLLYQLIKSEGGTRSGAVVQIH